MKRYITPTLQISIGILSLTLSIIFIAYSLGFFPDEEKAALEARAKISETLALQLANLAGRNEADAIKDTIDAVVGRNGDVVSMAVRGEDGKLLVGSRDHDSLWVERADGKSTATQVQIPLFNGDVPAGKIEIVFRPMAADNIFGMPSSMMGFVGFVGLTGFAGYFLILKRALWELDPSRAIPERVKAAFDTLAEGVLIMDEREFVLLANNAFVRDLYQSSKSLVGVNAGTLPWAASGAAAEAAGEFPWQTAMHVEQPVLGIPMAIRNPSGESRRLSVNATRIVDGRGIVRGVIATFDDVTLLHRANEQLNTSIQELHSSQVKISEQNRQLQLLASTDPLTGCLNRRTFFEKAAQSLQRAVGQRQSISFFMVDADHFKSINDRFGHVVGDKVLVGMADVLERSCGDHGLVGRYGGEEFCIAATGLTAPDAERLAERIRRAVADIATWLPGGERVTISIGIASLGSTPCELADLVKRADEALYAAKTAGRNRYVSWETIRPPTEAARPGQLARLLAGA